ncbi:protein of unknown function [Halopenitus malekzadehii]|uniref:DUF4382 domain-containing protein n=1 Tax=Halopenitus malekzadehii TaxID=1267564 RepID=A0A1H6I9Q6_9EURY|nr:DUF4382 domain-containing protein [Halopenitus malekzadehii]SEH43518.1 protein of unknown function [Halopenitus malekzadehii]
MQRRTYIRGITAAATTGAFAGCTGGNGGSDGTDGSDGSEGGAGSSDTDDGSTDATRYGTLSTSVTDQPNDIGDFESLVVTIDGIWIKPAESGDDSDDEDAQTPDQEATEDGTAETTETDTATTTDTATPAGTEAATATPDGEESDDEEADGDDGTDAENAEDADGETGRYYVEFAEPQEADLVQLQDGSTKLIDETEVEVGSYQFLQLDVTKTTGVLTTGEEADVRTPGNAPLQFKQSFEVRESATTTFIADFAPNRTGQGTRYIIRPVASGTTVRYGDESGAETTETTDTATPPGTEAESGTTDPGTESQTESPGAAQ